MRMIGSGESITGEELLRRYAAGERFHLASYLLNKARLK
jgi:hypothetical protein